MVGVNSDKIDDGEVTKDFDEDLKKILKLYCIVTFRVQLFFRQYCYKILHLQELMQGNNLIENGQFVKCL